MTFRTGTAEHKGKHAVLTGTTQVACPWSWPCFEVQAASHKVPWDFAAGVSRLLPLLPQLWPLELVISRVSHDCKRPLPAEAAAGLLAHWEELGLPLCILIRPGHTTPLHRCSSGMEVFDVRFHAQSHGSQIHELCHARGSRDSRVQHAWLPSSFQKCSVRVVSCSLKHLKLVR